MEIPDVDHAVWRDIVRGDVHLGFEHLGIQLFLGRAKIELGGDSSARTVERLARDLHSFVVKNQNHPKVKKDIARITGSPSAGRQA